MFDVFWLDKANLAKRFTLFYASSFDILYLFQINFTIYIPNTIILMSRLDYLILIFTNELGLKSLISRSISIV